MFYGINPPQIVNNDVYYKDIIVFSIEDDVVLGSVKFNLNGSKIPSAASDVIYNPLYSENMEITTNSKKILSTNKRTTWLFKSEKEAFMQKIICLSEIRDYFFIREQKNRDYFISKIPEKVNKIADDLIKENPEYFL